MNLLRCSGKSTGMRIEDTCDFLCSLPCLPVIYGDWIFVDAFVQPIRWHEAFKPATLTTYSLTYTALPRYRIVSFRISPSQCLVSL